MIAYDQAKKDYLEKNKDKDKYTKVELSRIVMAAKVHRESILALHTKEPEHIAQATELWTLYKVFHIHERAKNAHNVPDGTTEAFDELAKYLNEKTNGASFKVAWNYLSSSHNNISDEISEILDKAVTIEPEDQGAQTITISVDFKTKSMKKASFSKNYYSKFRKSS